MSSPPKKSDIEASFAALSAPAYDPKAAATRERDKKKQKTDFGSLKRELGRDDRRREGPGVTDYIVDVCVPVLVYMMVLSVGFFLLDVRFIYTAREHVSMRVFTFFMLMGVVALNRLVARDNTGDSYGYAIVFAGLVGFYTVVTTGAYGVGSFAGGYFDKPGWALLFNITAVVAAWWVANRLVHECSVDENRTAGDIGILTGTLRNLRQSIARSGASAPKKSWKDQYLLPSIEIEAYDPHDWKEQAPKKAGPPLKAVERLSRRHPGISIFYFAVPAMLIFTLGLPVLLRGGPPFMHAGHVYVGAFTLCALTLLLLTSLGGLREYFRSRRVPLPLGIGLFWAGLGGFMVIAVAVGALQMPMPRMPTPAYVEQHEIDPWSTVGERFELTPAAAGVADQVQQSKIIERVSQAVLAMFILFGLYSALRGLSILAGEIGKRRDRYPRWIVRLFDWLDRILERIVSLPEVRQKFRRGRPSAANAASTKFRNPMAGEGAEGKTEDVQRYIAHAFDALCALGEDLGRARRRDETPYEYLRHLPRELTPLKRESGEVVEWYVRSAYSTVPPDATILDRLRKFWFEYDRLRRRYIR